LLALQPNFAGYGLLIHEVFLDHTQPTQNSRLYSSGRVISSSQIPLPDNTQQLQQTPTISADERPQTYALDQAATGTGQFFELVPLFESRGPINNSSYKFDRFTSS